MNKLIVLSGVPGSGKSYFSNTIKKVFGSHVYIVSSDSIRNLICGNQQDLSEDETVWKMFYSLPKVYSLDKKGIVILDATHFSSAKRIDNVRPLREFFDETFLIVFNNDKQVVMNQNLQREFPIAPEILDRYFDIFEMPNKNDKEFFDKVIVINNNDLAKAIEAVSFDDSQVNLLTEL